MMLSEGKEGKVGMSERTCISCQKMLSTCTQLHEEGASAVSTVFDLQVAGLQDAQQS